MSLPGITIYPRRTQSISTADEIHTEIETERKRSTINVTGERDQTGIDRQAFVGKSCSIHVDKSVAWLENTSGSYKSPRTSKNGQLSFTENVIVSINLDSSISIIRMVELAILGGT